MEKKKLVRVNEGKVIGGVCTGLAQYFGMKVLIVRIIVLAIAAFGSLGIWAYLIAWALMGKAVD